MAAVVALTATSLAAVDTTSSASGGAPVCTIRGTDGTEILGGTSKDGVICGLGGRDILLGYGGDDTLDGGPGKDRLLGGSGDDTLQRGHGNDLRFDRHGENVLNRRPGSRDRCIGGPATFSGCELERRLPKTSTAAAGRAARVQQAGVGPRFEPTASRVAVQGDTLAVTFVETGLAAEGSANLEFSATRTTSVNCTDPNRPDAAALNMSSTAGVTETGTYGADAGGSISGVRTLHVAPGTIEIGGYTCRRTDEVTVVLRDLTSGATIRLTP